MLTIQMEAIAIESMNSYFQPYRNSLGGEELFDVAHRVFAKVKNAGGKDGIGSALKQHCCHVFKVARAAAGYNRNAHRLQLTRR